MKNNTENNFKFKNIFISALGQTPQVLTEALYGFWVQRKIPIHSIEVIATPSSKEFLLSKGFLDDRRNPFKRLYDDYGLKKKGFPFPKFGASNIHVPPGAKKDNLNDSRENALMEAEISNQLRTLTSDPETNVFASLAGGRKTMSAYMILGMTVFGRRQDELFHVLFDGPSGKTPEDWWYPHPRKPKEKKWVNLFEVPFPRLHQVIQANMPDLLYKPLKDVFFGINEKLKEPTLEIEVGQGTVTAFVNGQPVKAEPRQIQWLALLAHRKIDRRFCPPKIKLCLQCHQKPCALRTSDKDKAQFNLDEKDLSFLRGLYLWEEDGKNEKAPESLARVDRWAPAAARLRKNLQNQFPEHFEFMDSLGGKGPGAKARKHVIALDRAKIIKVGIE